MADWLYGISSFNTKSYLYIYIKYVWFTNESSVSSIFKRDDVLIGSTILGQGGSGRNGNDEVFHYLQSSRSVALPSDAV